MSMGRRPLSKAQLLPLAADHVRRLSLKHHLALAAVSAGRGDLEAIVTLLNVLYLTFFLSDDAAELELVRRAEAALDACTRRVEGGAPWALSDDEQDVLAQLMVTHDAQLASVRLFRYQEAWERVHRIACSGGRSPIPAAATPVEAAATKAASAR
ncbi:hypothetical protein WI25_35430 [Burkholderia cepacia]|uniref:hypothetical protein n=1 Tax=Burkholderia cepacia TaxID=292 RepID=UPI0007568C78|nr:hypothetical protein [Burkholderia cepacia]KUY84955.1 hypothetical protein WI25_35430 [Burkholderia cepacia]